MNRSPVKLSSARKILNILAGTLFLAFFAFAFWPILTAPVRMWLYCANVAEGENLSIAVDIAKDNGFQVAEAGSNRLRIYDLSSLGRVGCIISSNDAGNVRNAAMELSD